MGIERMRREGLKKTVADFLKDEGHRDESPEVELNDIKEKLSQLASASAKAAVISGSLMGGAHAEGRHLAPEHRGAIVRQASAPNEAQPQHEFVKPYVENAIEKHPLDKNDIDQLALNIYFEARNQSLLGQMGVALVTLSRTVSPNPGWGHSIRDIVHARGQFSWTNDKHNTFAAVEHDKEFEQLLGMVSHVFSGKALGDVRLALAEFTKLPLDTQYYKRTDLDLNGLTVSEATRKLFTEATPVGTIGDHSFYALRKLPKRDASSILPSPGSVPLPHEDPRHVEKEKEERS